eukprot:jgi/Chlat1/2373/Chrsp17S02814
MSMLGGGGRLLRGLALLLAGGRVGRSRRNAVAACAAVRGVVTAASGGQVGGGGRSEPGASSIDEQQQQLSQNAKPKRTHILEKWLRHGLSAPQDEGNSQSHTEQHPEDASRSMAQEYFALPHELRLQLLHALAEELRVSQHEAAAAAVQYAQEVNAASLEQSEARALRAEQHLRNALTPPYARLLHTLHGLPGGTRFLVDLRADLITALREAKASPHLRALDESFRALFDMAFSPALLSLRRITWADSAALLEKIVAHEAVHEIRDLHDLKRRLGHRRRCFAYLHPSMPGEPLVFIEVALTDRVSGSIQAVLKADDPAPESTASCAVFYSISSAQKGLQGVELGSFLIKRVLQELVRELPQLETFATLSPIPAFLHWLLPKLASSAEDGVLTGSEVQLVMKNLTANQEGPPLHSEACRLLSDALEKPGWHQDERVRETLQPVLFRLCAQYLLKEKKRSRCLDPVANFHVRNGACVHRIDWLADISSKGLAQSAGLMVNYLYEPADIETNNAAYLTRGIVPASRAVRELL